MCRFSPVWFGVASRVLLVLSALLMFSAPSALAQSSPASRFPGIGRTATAAELRAWDTDVRNDFAGLPPGSGSVPRGQLVWDAQCASCHGTFGESNDVFAPIVGGTTQRDQQDGRARALASADSPRTTIMKLSSLSTLWDYIYRAMPWANPKTLSVEEVYAVTAYILNLAEIVADDFVLSNTNIAAVQNRLPNRNGMRTDHGLWENTGKPDVRSIACMTDCRIDATVRSALPAHARDAHGNLADQNRLVGPVRGIVTVRAAAAAVPDPPAGQAVVRPAPALEQMREVREDSSALATKHACFACHRVDTRSVGPGFREIAAKYKNANDAQSRITESVKSGSVGSWGPVPMPGQGHVDGVELAAIVKWILAGAE